MNHDIGKLPPQAVELEEAVLGAVLIEKEAYLAISDRLFPELFYLEKHMLICEAIVALANRGEVIDILTVTQELKRLGKLEFVGGAHYVSSLTGRIASSAHVESHILVLCEMYIKREIIRQSGRNIKLAYEDGTDAFEVLDDWTASLTELETGLFIKKLADIGMLFDQVLEHNKLLRSKPGAIAGVTTGFPSLDRVLGGWHKTDLVIIAARPGMGKTAFVIRSAVLAAISGIPAVIFSLEMSALQLKQRILSQETEIPLDQFINSSLDDTTVEHMKRDAYRIIGRKADPENNVQSAPPIQLFIDDTAAISINDMKRKARKLLREKKIGLIIVDYLQLMTADGKGNREQEVSAISRGLKALAKELEIPIVALSQLSRETEDKTRTVDHRPKLKHLRDSGAIEQDADRVLFIYRPEYYGMTVDEHNESTAGKAEILIAKNRHGALIHVNLRFKGECTLFYDPTDESRKLNNSIGLQPNTDFIDNKRQLPQENDDLPF